MSEHREKFGVNSSCSSEFGELGELYMNTLLKTLLYNTITETFWSPWTFTSIFIYLTLLSFTNLQKQAILLFSRPKEIFVYLVCFFFAVCLAALGRTKWRQKVSRINSLSSSSTSSTSSILSLCLLISSL